jgi:gamma-D-glutamyl-L-lysine dipeptidyl-peptidase
MEAICCVPVAPMRSDPSHRSEMVSQILFGETCDITEELEDGWLRINTHQDHYIGCCQRSHFLTGITREDYFAKAYSGNWKNELRWNGDPMQIPLGCPLPRLEKNATKWMEVSVEYSGARWYPDSTKITAQVVKEIAYQFINTPYLWGGRTVYGIDCSGFSQMVYRLLGIALPRDAYQQAGGGELLTFLPEVKCGDLAFFDNEQGKITHVGILLNERQIIHASGKVRVDMIDHQGILQAETGERTHRLRVMKRFF